MPRYFFNIINGDPHPDKMGTEFPDVDRARQEAIRLSGEMLRELSASEWNGEVWRLDVTDTSGKILFIVRFSVETHDAGTPAPL